ncbi:MAG TPA: hypothetical protein VIZ18_04140, partial [Ktedonobacteraceae bacterium]
MMDDRKAPKTGQFRQKDYVPAKQLDAQTPPPDSTQGEHFSSVLTATDSAPIKKGEQMLPEAKTEDRSLAFSSTLKMPRIFTRPQSVRKMNKRFLLISGLACLAVLLMVGGLFAWVRIKALPPAVTLYQVGTQGFSQDIGGGGIVYPLQEEDISYPIA